MDPIFFSVPTTALTKQLLTPFVSIVNNGSYALFMLAFVSILNNGSYALFMLIN